jgi:soluble lytic murein transglycosylase-like protein
MQAADAYGIPRGLFTALVEQESGFNARAVGYAGEAGLTQLMPGTARGLGLRVDDEVDERFDPQKNLMAGAHYLRQQFDAFGSWEYALGAYNCGPGCMREALTGHGSLPLETERYIAIVLKLWRGKYADLDTQAQPVVNYTKTPSQSTAWNLILLTSAVVIAAFSVLRKILR